MLAGEHLPERPSLLNRCITIRLVAEARDDTLQPEIERLLGDFPGIGASLIAQRQREGASAFFERLAHAQDEAIGAGADRRLAYNLGVAIAGILPWTPTEELRRKVWDAAYALIKGLTDDETEHSYIGEFLRDLSQLRLLSGTDDRVSCVLRAGLDASADESHLSLVSLYPLWEEQLRRRGRIPPLSQRDLKRYLLEERLWVKEQRKPIDGHFARVLTLLHSHMPESLRDVWCK